MKSGSRNRWAYLLLALILLMLVSSPDADAQKRKRRSRNQDSLLTLLNAEYARVFERPGHREYREVKGPATFLHNGAYMFCDSAIWNVSFNQVEAYQNVKLVQKKTVLKSDNVIYYADDNLARFRGDLVEVYDKDKNTLRTRYLDYNTEDSTAKFTFGGAMRTSKGEIIESDRGTYDGKTGICRFEDNVEMFTDSLFIKTNSLDYDTNENKAYFGKKTQMWKRDIYLRGEYGWYAQDSGVVYFDTDVYMSNPDYEGWCDTLYYWQHSRNGRMRKNVELLDSLHKMYFVSDAANMSFDTVNNLYARLFMDPASIYVGENTDNQIDTLFSRADTMLFYTQRACDISEELKKDSEEARKQVNFDAIGEADKKAAEKKEQEKKAAIEKLPEYIAYKKRQEIAEKKRQDSIAAAQAKAEKDSLAAVAALAAADSLKALSDTPDVPAEKPAAIDSVPAREPALPEIQAAEPVAEDTPPVVSEELPAADSLLSAQDSLMASSDSLSAETPEAAADTTKLRFIKGYRNARIYRTDIQARADSIYFSQLDTLLRMYLDPVIWNDNRHQLTSEEVVMQMKDNSFDRANLHGNAMIISQEDSVHFDQIKSTEMLGYFNSDNTLRRFDALGGVNAMFYMQEDSVITILNSKQAQFMMVTMKNGTAERIKYYESVNSDAYPVYNLPKDKQRLKGFKWREDEQPKSRFDITRHKVRNSKRASYATNKLPVFRRANLYYDNYMQDIYHQIEERAEQARREQARRDSIEAAEQEAKSHFAADSTLGITSAFDKKGDIVIDSLATLKPNPKLLEKVDSTAKVDIPAGLSEADSLAAVRRQARLDSLAAERDAAKARLDSIAAAAREASLKRDTSASAIRPVAARDSAASAVVVIEGIPNHSDEGFVEVQLPEDTKNMTKAEKRALKKAARELKRQQKKLEREAKKAEREAKRAALKAEREAKRAAVKAEQEAKRAAIKAEKEAKRAALKAEKAAKKAAAEAEREAKKAAAEAEKAARENP
jgi:lipopolysaccharide export system protein LptA